MTTPRFIRCTRQMVTGADDTLATTRMSGQFRAGSLLIQIKCSVSAGKLRAMMLPWQTEHPDLTGGL